MRIITKNELNELIKTGKVENVELSEASLAGINLKGIEIVNVVFSTDAKESNLSGAEISNCRIVDSTFIGAILQNTSLMNSSIIRCNFDNSFIEQVDFKNTKLSRTRFRESYMAWCDFRYAKIEDCTFKDAAMKGCDFYRAKFIGNNIFDDSRIFDASLNKTSLEGAGIRSDNLHYGILQEYEESYREYHEKWDSIRIMKNDIIEEERTHQGLLQENGNNFKMYHERWAKIRKGKPDETLEMTAKKMYVFVQERYREAMLIYRTIQQSWVSKGFMRDAAWAYVKLKRAETKTFSPKTAWINYNRIIPDKIGKSLFEKKLLEKIDDLSDRDYLKSVYKFDSEKNSYLLKDDLEIKAQVKAREIFIWYKLPPFYSFLQRIKKLPEFFIYNLIDAICGFGENLSRILLSLASLILGFSAYTRFFNGLLYKDSNISVSIIDHLIFSLGNLTGTKPERIIVANSTTELLLSLQAFFGIALIGLFGFVLGNKIRNR